MADLTPEQRAAARSALMPHVAWGQGTIQADLDAAIDALMAAGWAPVRDRAEACIVRRGAAIDEALRLGGSHDEESALGKLAQLRDEALINAIGCSWNDNWVGVIENLAEAEAYQTAEYCLRDLARGVWATTEQSYGNGYRSGLKRAAYEVGRSFKDESVALEISAALLALADKPEDSS